LIASIKRPQLLNKKWGASPTDEEIVSGFGLFDKSIIEERETWTAELWRSGGNARGKDFGGPVSSCSVKSWILHRI
jgi:hypothetical protein